MTEAQDRLSELEEQYEVLDPDQLAHLGEHEHRVNNWVWGDSPDGHVWQVGACVVCHEDVTRNSTGADYSAWVVMP